MTGVQTCALPILTRVLVRDIYTRSERRHLADVRDEHGVWNALFLADVVSGASLKNVVDRAKTYAVKASITSGRDVALNVDVLARAVEDEYRETRDSLLDADAVQWSRVNGFDAGSVEAIRAVEH